MKQIILFIIISLLSLVKINAQNYEISTLRIGSFKYNMTLKEVNEITEKPLFNGKNYYDGECKIATIYGQQIKLDGLYDSENANPNEAKVYGLSTKSAKFKTKSGIGVGSTKEDLFKAYKDYPNFSVGQRWDTKTDKLSTKETYFTLEDVTAYTRLMFILIENIVVEVVVYMNEGC